MPMVPKITTVATATATFEDSAFTTGAVASTAAAPQMLLPAPISQAVFKSRFINRAPIKVASRKVLLSITISIATPLNPTSITC